MRSAHVNGTSLHYDVDGDGPPLIVVHGGLGFDHVVYRRTMTPLHDGRQVIFYDQRGNGRSHPVDLATVTIEQLADDVVGLADALGIGRFTALGHSYGGFVAQELAARHPDRLDALILVSTTPGQLGTGESPEQEQGPPPPPGLVELLQRLPADDAEMAATIDRMLPYYFHRSAVDAVAPLFEGTIYRAAVMARGFEVLGSWSSVDRLASIDVPTLIVAGRHDVVTSYPQSYRIASRIPGAEVVVLDDSAHFPWIEEPEPFFTTVTEWLDRTIPRR